MTEPKDVDVYKKKVMLVEALAQLEKKEKLIQSSNEYKKAYFWSIVVPPIGIYYFFKYLFFAGERKSM